MARAVAAARDRFGPVSILVANAGGPGGGTAADVTDAAWAESLQANLSTCLVSARACLPDLIETGGAIVVVSSIAGLAASPESVGYVTAKHGLIGLARSMARDFGPRGVRVNVVCPGWVRTPMADAEMDQLMELRGLASRDAAYELATSQVPLRRPAGPDEVAAVIAFLAGPAGVRGHRRRAHGRLRRYRGRSPDHRLRPGLIRWLARACAVARRNVRSCHAASTRRRERR